MSVLETLLIFAGIPAVVITAVFGLTFVGGARRSRRYRPGRPYSFTPVWFLAAPPRSSAAGPRAAGPQVAGPSATALPAPPMQPAPPSGVVAPAFSAAARDERTGGASDRW